MHSATVNFAKMNGIGNQILVVDMRGRKDHISPKAAVALNAHAETEFGQIMAIHDPRDEGTFAYIQILNSDGSEAGACGNGTRCVVTWLRDMGEDLQNFAFNTLGGLRPSHWHEDGTVSVDMGVPHFEWQDIPLSKAPQSKAPLSKAQLSNDIDDIMEIELQYPLEGEPLIERPSVANIGNPHVTFFTSEPIENYPLLELGPILEHHPLFPDRVNVTLAHVLDKNTINMATWERGAGFTTACGSAACAALVNAARRGLVERSAKIIQPGGPLMITWNDDNHIVMRGATEFEFSGILDPQTGEWQKVEGAT